MRGRFLVSIFLMMSPFFVWGATFPWHLLSSPQNLFAYLESQKVNNQDYCELDIFGIPSREYYWTDRYSANISIRYGGLETSYESLDDAENIINSLTDNILSQIPNQNDVRVGKDVPTIGNCNGNAIFNLTSGYTICIYKDINSKNKFDIVLRISYTNISPF